MAAVFFGMMYSIVSIPASSQYPKKLTGTDRCALLPKPNGTEIQGKAREPLDFALFPNFLQVREFLPATRTRCFWLHLDQPIGYTFTMKCVNASWIGRPGHDVSDLVTAETNRATIWNQISISKFQLSRFFFQGRETNIISSGLNINGMTVGIISFENSVPFYVLWAFLFFDAGITRTFTAIITLYQIRFLYSLSIERKKGKISLNHRHACFRRCVSIRARKEPLAMNEANILPFELCSSRSLCGAAVVV